jgi:hypothetical protein
MVSVINLFISIVKLVQAATGVALLSGQRV